MNKVKVWEEIVVIPTYEAGEPDKNPIFLEKRVYQGSSGKIYPHSVIDSISDEKHDKKYKALFLENDYIKVMMLPELGGRIQRAYDKTNDYDFIYYNQVIKPALVGLAGPWISGGIEFNWPQHHRPSTFDPVEYSIIENEDGSATVCMGEIENMFRTEGVLCVTMYPDKAYMELSAKIYNRTNVPQTFLWWANPAVAVNDDTISVFPEDVNAVYDHGKRDVISFPYAEGEYYKHYYDHVNIARYKNIPVPTSYMAYRSDYNFIGEYDYGKQAGLLHVADHHISPGKKQWTWGNGEFGKAWDRALTDEDGPYIELMTGCFTDNQPDFTWLLPQETKNFKQYFMPYKNIGYIKNATIDGAVNVQVQGNSVTVSLYTTAVQNNARLLMTLENEVILDEIINVSPVETYEKVLNIPTKETLYGLKTTLISEKGKEIVAYTYNKPVDSEIPEPAKAAPLPCECETLEDLFLYGKHIEQYRHATYNPEDYYLEGLRRDETDIRLNNAYGLRLMAKCDFATAEEFFRRAVKKATRSNPNPYDMEPYYNLGLALKLQGKLDEAYDAFYKAIWGGSYQASGFYQLACIAAMKKDYETAFEHIEESILRQYHNMKARALKEMLLQALGRETAAEQLHTESIRINPLYDRRADKVNHNTLIELINDCYEAGMYEKGIGLGREYEAVHRKDDVYPMVYYYMAYGYDMLGDEDNSIEYAVKGENASSLYCFPHRTEDYIVLSHILKAKELPMASYYLGCLLYDKRVYDTAIACFEKTAKLKPQFPTAHRNLALAYYNVKNEADRALAELYKAFELDKTDARVFMELDQLLRKVNTPLDKRLMLMEENFSLVEKRDDIYLEYVTTLNTLGQHEKALSCIEGRQFHQWEGGEGKVSAQYLLALYELAKIAYSKQNYKYAKELLLKAADEYPHNLGEGKLESAQENNIYYYLGLVNEALDNKEAAIECYAKASLGISEPAGMMYYNDQPPETIFYQGLALKRLGRNNEAEDRFNKLINYGKIHIDDDVHIDYFAVSLPDLLIFNEDLKIRNKKHCLFMMSLGYLGLGMGTEYEECRNTLMDMDYAHQGIRLIKA